MSSMTQVPDTGPQAVASKVLNGLHGVDGPKVLHIVQHSLTLCQSNFLYLTFSSLQSG